MGERGRNFLNRTEKILNTNYKTAKANYVSIENLCSSKTPYKEREEGSHRLGEDTILPTARIF